MRENRPSGSEGGAGENPLFLPLSGLRLFESALGRGSAARILLALFPSEGL
jgi:hypothetical protein